MPKDETGLSWSGAPRPVRTGGFVGSVSMNADPRPGLAVDPDAPALPAPRAGRPAGAAGPALEGASVDVKVMTPKGDGRERPRGRFKMPLG